MAWDKIADDKSIETAAKALTANGFSTFVVENGSAAKQKALELIPKGAEVFTATSMTVDAIGLSKELNESGNFISVRNKMNALDRNTQKKEMAKLGGAPDWVVGSVHALTEDGKAIIASASGSQLPAYSFGAQNVLWIVGAQKIVKDESQGMKRIYEHTLPLESERAKKAYGVPGSFVAKLLTMNKEFAEGRIKIIIVKEVLGY
jgi:L-lactate utilization protein LutC